MPWDIEEVKNKAEEEINCADDLAKLEALRIKYLARKGIVAEILKSLPNLPLEERPRVGQGANELKNLLTRLFDDKVKHLKQTSSYKLETASLDITLPGIPLEVGHKHPLTQTLKAICEIFQQMGFQTIEGPEIETEFNNFTALNIPLEHPSRDAFDTFYIKHQTPNTKHQTRVEKLLLRSHTSPGQIRVMQTHKPPLAVVVPGKVYRPDAVDASHSFMFHQVEGFLVDECVRFSDLKGVLTRFAQEFFPAINRGGSLPDRWQAGAKNFGGSKDIKMRFRPHFFPFTEPSAEIDISCIICKGKGCSVCGKKGWLEILGAGMIHPKVFEAVGYPKNKYTGFAFGMGVERIAMLKYGIDDIRLFFENDLRFLRQF